MRDYMFLERPVANHSEAVKVYLKVSLQQLIDVDEKNQIVHINAWLNYRWKDYKLVWDPTEYGNITDIRFPTVKLWKPDALLYNSVDPNFDSTYPTNIVVQNNGECTWIPPGIFKVSCKINIRWFPFDEQRCALKFGSWTYDGFKLDLQPDENGFDISEYLPNGEWALPLTTVIRNEKRYDCCPEPYLDLTFYLHLRRRTLYYGFNLIMPCLLTTAMSLLGFTLPPDAGEKITLQITVLLSICFFLSILSEMSPATSEAVPLLGIFFSCCMVIVTLSTVFTVYVLNLHYRTSETHEMGVTSRTVLLYWLPYLLRMERPGVVLTWECLPPLLPWTKPKKHSESLIRNIKDVETGSSRKNSLDIEHRLHQYIMTGKTNGMINYNKSTPTKENKISCCSTSNQDNTRKATLLILQRIYNELKIITKRLVEADRDTAQSNDWKFAAIVVDRLCLYIFSFFIFATCLGIVISAPYIIA
uniref:Neuronal acetylcholine receptor subunit alpha-7 (inferred by orthology to a C. elegans protein) n=1 Tax=Strongyloides venezuelensis TaxID=75913 RepID=A0A0K0FNG3_STRVS